jgi:restriction system protein
MNYYRIILGHQHSFANECFDNNFVGVDYNMNINLENDLPDNWREFNKKFIPTYLEKNPEKTNVAAGLACGAIHTLSKAINVGDYVLCPNGAGTYRVGEISGDYFYREGPVHHFLRHCRSVNWLKKSIKREDMSEALKRSSGATLTVTNLTPHSEEINVLLQGESVSPITSTNPMIEDPSEFALEKHLEDFLVTNWDQTELSKKYDIFEEGEFSGQQYVTDTGPIDILAISKDKKELLVIELKKGRASDNVVGQVQRYMGYIKDEIATSDQEVKGVIIAFEDDQKIKRALSVTNNISFYKYRINFSLIKSDL